MNTTKKIRTPLSFLCAAAIAAVGVQAALAGTNLDDPSFDTMPEVGMVIHKSPAAEDALEVKIVSDNVHEGSGCLEISLPVSAYASVSFPLQQSARAMDLQFAYRVETSAEGEIKFGVQSFTMADGFQSVDFRPLTSPEQMGSAWRVFRGRIERAEGATHWQLSIAISGPGTVWIDQLEASPE
jgi:hypothetical protein